TIVFNNYFYKNVEMENKQLVLLKTKFSILRKLLKKNLAKIDLTEIENYNYLIKKINKRAITQSNLKYKNKINITFLYNQIYKNILIPWELVVKFLNNSNKLHLGDLFKLHYKIKTKNKQLKFFNKRKSNYIKINN